MRLSVSPLLRSLAVKFLGIVLIPSLCFGSLSWTTQRIEMKTKPGDKEAIGVFHFVNSGGSSVTITSVQPSCGCTSATLEKRLYAPGEQGEIKAIFTLGDRVGEQEKSVYVTTDESPSARTSLVLHVNIPELLTYSPRLLIWDIGSALAEKATILSANDNLKITAVEFSSPAPKELVPRLEPVEAGRKYQLLVRPVSTAQVMNVSLGGTATFADGTIQPFKIYVLVR